MGNLRLRARNPMRARTLTAIQFSVWTLAAAELIPFSNLFMFPVLWILDKKIALVTESVGFWTAYSYYYLGALHSVPHFQDSGFVPYIPLLLIGEWALFLLVHVPDLTIGAWFLKRKLRKKAPDILERL